MIIFPRYLDLTPNGELEHKADIGEVGYAENIEYELDLEMFTDTGIIQYHGEDNTILEAVCPNYNEQLWNIVLNYNGVE